MSGETNYNSWTKTGLIQRVKELEGQLKRRSSEAAHSVAVAAADDETPADGVRETKKPKGPHAKRKMDPWRYSSRFIALKLAYLGKNYGGFEFQAMGNQPSIEEELWNALTKACLIFPQDERVVQFECCEYSKCGRTDRGVSAFGQVVGLRVRSNRPLAKRRAKTREDSDPGDAARQEGDTITQEDATAVAGKEDNGGREEPQRQEKDGEEEGGEGEEQDVPFDDLKDELCYPRILNRLLPDDIRILAWCPSPPKDFSARFSCRERQYRYFFTQPAFMPDPTTTAAKSPGGEQVLQSGWLDIEAMRDAAKRFEGDHDFRNFCKIDPAKQITNFRRRIFESDIVQVEDASSVLPFLQNKGYSSSVPAPASAGPYPKVYYFHVRGSAFLWHQIRHMVAILFLVGQRLESPAVVSELLDTDKNPCRPSYVMADEVPLVLWDCIFPDLTAREEEEQQGDDDKHHRHRRTDCMNWIYVGDEHPPNKFGQFGVMESTWRLWRGHKMDELLSAQLLDKISQQGQQQMSPTGDTAQHRGGDDRRADKKAGGASERIFEGGNGGRLGGRYVPVMKKELLQSAEEQNDRYARRKGYADAADMRAQRYGDARGEGEEEE
ncbi:hypothetical protein E4U43_007346 [Claviceps pusilla]|uniref:Pseudouridine synthase I TruA alpha/beta domain-containing protein n=1 Tax=Claviceps pusilla TaxID=123648 RepID=A0A9P7NDP0_9HYPO|nr:hypothetical protein E4U43_007346 [Claviceps pusilla]